MMPLSGYGTNDVETVDTVTYVGMSNRKDWVIQKIDTASGTVIRYASSRNNTETTYEEAWEARAELTYEYYHLAS